MDIRGSTGVLGRCKAGCRARPNGIPGGRSITSAQGSARIDIRATHPRSVSRRVVQL